MSTRKSYTYKIFNGDAFISDIDPNLVKSEFSYSQDINTFFSQIQVDLSTLLSDAGPDIMTDDLVNESAVNIVDENGINLAVSISYTFSQLPLYVGYILEVWLSYSNNLNGIRVFSGTIMGWEGIYGGDQVSLIVMSNGIKLKNFVLQNSALTTTMPSFNSVDPSSIVRAAVDEYTATGGTGDLVDLVDENSVMLVDENGIDIAVTISLITYDTSITDTGTTITYQFNMNTLMEAIQKALELAPANWFYYVDVGSGLLYFREQAQVAKHTFVLKQHLETLDLTYTIENLINTVYFSGGVVSGANILRVNSDSGSVSQYGTWLSINSDQRVLNNGTADLLSQGIIEQNSQPSFRTVITIPSSVYDIETISVGDMVNFANADSIINSLLLQVVRLNRTPDMITLYLNSVLPRVTHRIEDIKRNLDVLSAVNNPSIPSN